MHVWTETHSLLFLLQQTVLQMSSIIPSSLPSHSSTLSHTIMAIAPIWSVFSTIGDILFYVWRIPHHGTQSPKCQTCFFSQPPLQLGSGHVVRLLQSDPPPSQATLRAKSPIRSGSPCCVCSGDCGGRGWNTPPPRPLETRQQ